MSTTFSGLPGAGTSLLGPTGRPGIDPRGPRVVATITAALLAVVLLTAPGAIATTLLAAQTAVFAVGAVRGIQHTPYSWVFRRLVRPRLAPPAHLEDPAPPRFAQSVGLAFTTVALVAALAGATTVAAVAVGLALAAALLNAVFGFCLGCEVYLLLARLRAVAVPAGATTD